MDQTRTSSSSTTTVKSVTFGASFSKAAYPCHRGARGKEAKRAWLNGHYQLVVLDLMLPGDSGLDLARWLRSQGEVPIVMLTAMGEETDRIIGLELGRRRLRPQAIQSAGVTGSYPSGAARPATRRSLAMTRRCVATGSAGGR